MSSGSYSELASSLSCSMKLNSFTSYVESLLVNRKDTVSQERFEEEVDSLFQKVPQPPFLSMVSGAYARVTDIPPILMCDNESMLLFEE